MVATKEERLHSAQLTNSQVRQVHLDFGVALVPEMAAKPFKASTESAGRSLVDRRPSISNLQTLEGLCHCGTRMLTSCTLLFHLIYNLKSDANKFLLRRFGVCYRFRGWMRWEFGGR
jgi:hypothetical protein